MKKKTGIEILDSNTWQLSEAWNSALVDQTERELQPRSNLWASELGKAPVDIWLKMKGEKPTNLPNDRSKRKFEAGNVFEWIVKLILLRAGILQSTQKWVSYQYPGLLEVTGRIDFVAGGKPNYEMAKAELTGLMLPDVFMRAGIAIISHLVNKFPDGLEEMPIEVKSVSSFMFEAMKDNRTSLKIHKLQLYHYMKSLNYKHGLLVYICRDDLRMAEYLITDEAEPDYKESIEIITDYYNRDEQPPLEQPIVWDPDLKRFAKNFNVAYSMYLTKLYGFKTQADFDDKYTRVVEGFNRVMTRIKDGKEMTKNNEEKLGMMIEMGFDLEEIKQQCSQVK